MGDFNIASLKLQVKLLINALTKSGFNYKIISLNTSEPESLDLVGSPDMVIVSKLNTHKRYQNNMAMSNLAALARINAKIYPLPLFIQTILLTLKNSQLVNFTETYYL